MSDQPFAISTSSSIVKSKSEGRTTILYSVTNQSGRSIEGLASVNAGSISDLIRLHDDDATEYLFQTGETRDYRLLIDDASSIDAGGYPVRLDMTGTENPDELYVEGPTVSLQVEGLEPEESKGLKWWVILLLVLGIIAVIGGGAWAIIALTNKDKPTEVAMVPQLANLEMDEALKQLRGIGFVSDSVQFVHNANVPVYSVVNSLPPKDAEVAIDSVIILRVSKGPSMVRVPDVAGLRPWDAGKKIAGTGLWPSKELNFSVTSGARGKVVASSPGKNINLPGGTEVVLRVNSNGLTSKDTKALQKEYTNWWNTKYGRIYKILELSPKVYFPLGTQ